jgi:hypothetical protein
VGGGAQDSGRAGEDKMTAAAPENSLKTAEENTCNSFQSTLTWHYGFERLGIAMRSILKLLAAPVALVLKILTAFFSFILAMSNVFFVIASFIVFVAAAVLLCTGYTVGGLLWLGVAFLVSPFGLPALAGWLVKVLARAGDALTGFIFG